jgi:hypothetical protein
MNNKNQSKLCINKHGASKIIDTFKTYQASPSETVVPGLPDQIIAAPSIVTSLEGIHFGAYVDWRWCYSRVKEHVPHVWFW